MVSAGVQSPWSEGQKLKCIYHFSIQTWGKFAS